MSYRDSEPGGLTLGGRRNGSDGGGLDHRDATPSGGGGGCGGGGQLTPTFPCPSTSSSSSSFYLHNTFLCHLELIPTCKQGMEGNTQAMHKHKQSYTVQTFTKRIRGKQESKQNGEKYTIYTKEIPESSRKKNITFLYYWGHEEPEKWNGLYHMLYR